METRLDISGRPVPTDESAAVDAGFVGCGSHAFRNIYPTLQFADVNLVATCDLDEQRAALFADQFGADRSYASHEAMLAEESLDAVFAVLNYDDEGRPRYPGIAADAMRAGCDVWIEKPPAASTAEIEELQAVEDETGQFVLVGFKKCFAPGMEKLGAITDREEFGAIDTLSVRYPQSLPLDPGESRTHDPSLIGLLDHIAHPGSILSFLGDGIERVVRRPSPGAGEGGFVTVEFAGGAVGTVHMAAGSSGASPLERVEVVGEGANAVLENGVDLIYYRPADRGEYGRTPDYTGPVEEGPVHWEPEFSLGQLYNKNLFALGYYSEVQHFAECCLDGRTPEKGGLEMAHEVLALYEAILEPGATPLGR